MGQSLDTMSQNQSSKGDLLYQLVHTGNVEAIKALCREGASLEWIDKEGKTPLIVACLDSGLFNVAKALIDMGANVNAYRPGRHAGTPLHHAAKRGLEQTVNLLLSNGANALVRNDDCQTALDVARINGHTHVLRAIESHICYFRGWLREFYGPGFLEALAPQFVSRKIWAVVIPCGSSNPMKAQRLIAIYPTVQDVQPRTVIALWKATIEEPKFDQSDPGLIIFDQSTRTRYKFASGSEDDSQQLHRFYDACKGIRQVMPLPPHQVAQSGGQAVGYDTSDVTSPVVLTSGGTIAPVSSAPSAPPIPDDSFDEWPIHYRSIDLSPVDFSVPATEQASVTNDVNDQGRSSSCIICWEAPVEGACIPCGHMAGCMACLSEIKTRDGVCPVCRTNINQVQRLYAV